MTAAGFNDYSAFVKAVYGEVQRHAGQEGWIPVYYNLGDEPMGDDLRRSAENAEAYRRGVPQGPALLHRRQQLLRATTARTRTCGFRRPCTSPTGTGTTRPR